MVPAQAVSAVPDPDLDPRDEIIKVSAPIGGPIGTSNGGLMPLCKLL